MTRSYQELKELKGYAERLEYLKLLDNNVTSPRHISGDFYKGYEWRQVRKMIIDRDGRFDLGVFGVYIDGPVYVHHIEPITEEDIINHTFKLTDPNNLICVSMDTHNRIHYKPKQESYTERYPGDTKLW